MARVQFQSALQDFFKLESASSILLLGAAVLALLMNNTPILSDIYQGFLHLPLGIRLGEINLDKYVLLWINDGLMAVFFFLIGLELKRELLEGQLASLQQAILPLLAAIGGMLVPAIIYTAVNWGQADSLQGWAIPAATDIAFSLGVLVLLKGIIPDSLRIFLLALAIIDDMGAIIIIAAFYSAHGLELTPLYYAGGAIIALAVLNMLRVTRITPYIILGVILWVCVLKSGIHATLAGVALAIFIPLRTKGDDTGHSPLRHLEHVLHPWVAFAIMPIFAFANAGVSFVGVSLATLTGAVPLGIMLGLFLGKQVGVLGFTWLAIKFKIAKLPEHATWMQVYGVAVLCGIGFTMSLFIGGLAFGNEGDYANQVKLGVIAGSLLSAVFGYVILRYMGNQAFIKTS
ncbi:Na+/H+ antiporter NhaA [Beggiatoa leptomitoformis]|uniref:Na(+)/H(+) antiporter NhaA n=1 Tax=Beggiatoa leptomitoformis TaxID=288004 RepID=A0A2N9YIF1_9GAMM|nr:Na+/H+ antiporter NhaA [Beggiatoa leptomitoformis]ALG67491.1 Na+/H+ antiporter NhaA [Beggiatoa leptomitoformis]AUI70287.1 Na+/H+ antiporter NhaA [Beggiatoa leptomitoformis]